MKANKNLNSGTVFLLVFLTLFGSANVVAQLAVCNAGYSRCQYGSEVAYSSCRTLIRPGTGITEATCSAKRNKLLNQCSVGRNQCTETYIHPKANVVSVLYMPPGDQSKVGYSSTASNGKTSTYGNYWNSSNSLGLSANIYGATVDSSVAINRSQGWESSFTSTVQSSTGTVWSTIGNPINHSKDVMTVWLNPVVTEATYPIVGEPIPTFTDKGMTVLLTSLDNSAYSPQANNSKGDIVIGSKVSQGSASLINVRMENLLQPNTLLPSQLVSKTNSDGSIVPGLLALCENRIPESQCTTSAAQTNACGCSVSDFTFLIEQHPFFSPNLATQSVEAINAIDPNGSRFVPVKDASGYNMSIPIQAGVTKTFSLTDTYNSSHTYSQKVERSVETKVGFSYAGIGAKSTLKESFTSSMGKSTSTGRSNTQSVTLATTSNSCYGYVNVYIDTVFHTFLFTNASNAPNPCP